MNKELKPCPFCGGKEIGKNQTSFGIDAAYCEYCGASLYLSRWDYRPIEDELNAKIDNLEIEKQQLEADLLLIQEKYEKAQSDNRQLVEQVNAMALQPNQEVITWHRWPEERPEMSDDEPVTVLCASGAMLWFATYDQASEKLWCENESWEPHVALYWAYLPKGVSNGTK